MVFKYRALQVSLSACQINRPNNNLRMLFKYLKSVMGPVVYDSSTRRSWGAYSLLDRKNVNLMAIIKQRVKCATAADLGVT